MSSPESLPQTAQLILKENSIQKTIPFFQVELLLSQITAKTQKTPQEIFNEIGSAKSTYYEAKREGKTKLIIKFALEGYLNQIGREPEQNFNLKELSTIFYSLISSDPITPEIKSLIIKTSDLLTQTIEKS